MSAGSMPARAPRSSNLELARILCMVLIVAHHYVVNSGVTALFPSSGLSANALFLQLWGMWGKTAINVFVLITGWFMCERAFRWERFARLLLQVELYRVLLFPAWLVSGAPVTEIARKGLGLLLWPLMGANAGFTASFTVFYLLIPFLNALLSHIGCRRLGALVCLLLSLETLAFTFLGNDSAFSEVSWYATLYLLAAYMRRRPRRLTEDPGVCTRLFALCAVLSVLSVLALDGVAAVLGRPAFSIGYYMVADSGKALSFLTGLTCFLFFKNLRMRDSRVVNAVAATTFGVLLIHANSDAMRELLWGRLLDVRGAYGLPLPALVLHAAVSAVGVFAACSAVDRLRIRIVEPPPDGPGRLGRVSPGGDGGGGLSLAGSCRGRGRGASCPGRPFAR